MPFAKHVSKELSCHHPHSQIRLPRQINRSAAPDCPSNCDRPLLTSSQEDRSQPAILESMPRLMVEGAARFAEHAGTAFPNLMIAIISWTVAEFLAGCAAYGKAMYPAPLMADECVVSGVAVPTACSTPAILPQKGKGKPSLIVIAGNGNRSIRGQELCLRLEQTAPAAGARADAENEASPTKEPDTGSPSPVWIIPPAISWLVRLRRARAQRQAIVGLRSLDDRAPGDIGISRCDVENLERHGAPRE